VKVRRFIRIIVGGLLLSFLLAEDGRSSDYVSRLEALPKKGIDYGPFRDGQQPGGPCPSLEQILEDMRLLRNMGATAIRTYGICDCALGEKILVAARGTQTKVILGLWISSNRKANECEIHKLKELVDQHENVVIRGVSVGSEVLLRRDIPINDLVAYVKRVKRFTSVPVTTVETWRIWMGHDVRFPDMHSLHEVVDFHFVNIHPYWDGVEIRQAMRHVLSLYGNIKDAYPGKDVIISETGWPSGGLPNGAAVPSIRYQRKFIRGLARSGLPFYYFAGFDEKWKVERNGVGPHWGVYLSTRWSKHPFEFMADSLRPD